jgi:hypothetical protein
MLLSAAETWIGSLDGGEPRLLLRAEAVAHYAEPGHLLFKRGPLFAQRVEGPDLRFVGDPVRLTDAAVGSSVIRLRRIGEVRSLRGDVS